MAKLANSWSHSSETAVAELMKAMQGLPQRDFVLFVF
jgi:hypothetical protein